MNMVPPLNHCAAGGEAEACTEEQSAYSGHNTSFLDRVGSHDPSFLIPAAMTPPKVGSPLVRSGIDAASCHKCYLRPGVEVKRLEVLSFLFA
jgi:hypothetical protein